MSWWFGVRGGAGRLGIILLILGLGRVPLPMPDYHGFEHVDLPGQPCPNHDHLHRDHPGDEPRDRSTLHWHWVVLNPAALCGVPSTLGGESPECHPDWSACEHDPSPQFVASRAARRLPGSVASIPSIDLPAQRAGWSWAPARPAPAHRARSFVATYPPRISSSSLLQRWIC